MQPSSLIFVAVIGIWAAFLVQHWVRRREDLATARSLDRFSEAMRVLQRSPVVAAPTPRPSLAIREATEGHDAPLSRWPVGSAPASPLIARSSQRASAPVDAHSDPLAAAPVSRPGALRRPMSRSVPRRSVPRRAMMIRRAWALLGLLALVAVPVAWVLALTDVLARWVPLLPIAALVLAVGALRMAAVRERTSRHTGAQLARARSASASTQARPRARVPHSATAARAAAEAVATPIPEMPDTQGIPDEHERVSPSAPQIVPARPAVVAFAGFGVDPATVELSHAGLGMPWSPVAVPPPTYTLKDKAPALPPVALAEVSTSDVASDVSDEVSLDVPVRRAVGD